MESPNISEPARRVLVVVTVGGSTNSAPIFEVCSILAARGHIIEFATLEGRQDFARAYPFVSAIHVVGRAITEAEDEAFYLDVQKWDNSTRQGRRQVVKIKQFSDSFWPETYAKLKSVVQQARPDIIFSDYQVDASRDVANEYNIPLVMMWPQMPWFLAPLKWIPGEPGTQTRCLTSEKASYSSRLYDSTYVLRWLVHLVKIHRNLQSLRRKHGAKDLQRISRAPDHLILINSFFGLEPAKDLPPLMQMAGPILSADYQALNQVESAFLTVRQAVVYVAFGTHMIPTAKDLSSILSGLALGLRRGLVDGVIWSMKHTSRKSLDLDQTLDVGGSRASTWRALLSNEVKDFLFEGFSSQQAILAQPSTILFVTHAGPSSVNESIFHGTPMIAIPIGGDQMQESMRLCEAGLGLKLEKTKFTADDICHCIRLILEDRQGTFRRNVLRMQRIARVAARRKHHAADMIEEYMFDWELRFELREFAGRSKELSPMHLQTADVRMTWLRAKNLDMLIIVALVCAIVASIVVLGVEIGRTPAAKAGS